MGNVVQQARLRVHRGFQPLRHGVKITHQLRHLIPAPSGKPARPGTQIARRQPLRSGPQPNHRGSEISSEQVTDQPRRNNSDENAQARYAAWAKRSAGRQECHQGIAAPAGRNQRLPAEWAWGYALPEVATRWLDTFS